MKHILRVNPVTTDSYIHTTDWINQIKTHRVPHITPEYLPKDRFGGILFSKIEIYPGAQIEPEALSWVLSMLRDVKEESSGTGN